MPRPLHEKGKGAYWTLATHPVAHPLERKSAQKNRKKQFLDSSASSLDQFQFSQQQQQPVFTMPPTFQEQDSTPNLSYYGHQNEHGDARLAEPKYYAYTPNHHYEPSLYSQNPDQQSYMKYEPSNQSHSYMSEMHQNQSYASGFDLSDMHQNSNSTLESTPFFQNSSMWNEEGVCNQNQSFGSRGEMEYFPTYGGAPNPSQGEPVSFKEWINHPEDSEQNVKVKNCDAL